MATPDVHIKARILQLLHQHGELWDYEVFERISAEYPEVQGEYWYGTVRLNLADLFSSGLTREVDQKVDPSKSYGDEKILLRFALTEFGLTRMQETGILEGAR